MPPSVTSTLNAVAGIYLSNLGVLEFVSAIICALLIAAIVVIVVKTNWLGLKVERFRHVVLKTNLPKETAKKEWAKIEEHFYKGDENDLKVAIIEADKLLEEALRESGIRGSHLGDRLKNLKPAQLPNLDQIWQAHRLRNDIVHQPTFKLKRDLAERALTIYHETLKSFQLLD
jgi:uncharacterized membrane protein YraQ (UPF0718 family)